MENGVFKGLRIYLLIKTNNDIMGFGWKRMFETSEKGNKSRVILHCDLNNFFASVECAKNKELRGKPVAVCGNPELRKGVVLAKSEQAKKAGVKTGMVIWEAKKICPDIIVVPTDYVSYAWYSRKVREIYYRFTNQVESFGIDECWLDVTGSQKLFGNGVEIANKIREAVKKEVGLTISVGVSYNRTYAKLGSDLKKPDAVTEITLENYKDLIYPLPLADLLFVGRKTKALLEKLNVFTIGDLANFDVKVLSTFMGINAEKLIASARGEDYSIVTDFYHADQPKSVGNGTTLPKDLTTNREVEQVLYLLSEKVAYRMRKKNLKGYTVNLSVKSSEFTWAGAQESLVYPTNAVQTILNTAIEIFRKVWVFYKDSIKPVRSLRVSVSHLTEQNNTQVNLFADAEGEERNDTLSKVFDKVRKKYGTQRIMYGGTAESYRKLGYELDFEELDEMWEP